jgi:hypothetical protein
MSLKDLADPFAAGELDDMVSRLDAACPTDGVAHPPADRSASYSNVAPWSRHQARMQDQNSARQSRHAAAAKIGFVYASGNHHHCVLACRRCARGVARSCEGWSQGCALSIQPHPWGGPFALPAQSLRVGVRCALLIQRRDGRHRRSGQDCFYDLWRTRRRGRPARALSKHVNDDQLPRTSRRGLLVRLCTVPGSGSTRGRSSLPSKNNAS